MKSASRFLEIEPLRSLQATIGSSWVAFGADELLPEFDVAPEAVQFETSTGSFALSARDEEVDLWDEPDSLAVLYLVERPMSNRARRRGKHSKLFSGSRIKNVHLLLSELVETIDGGTQFKFRSHDGVVFELDKGWIGFSKESLWNEDIHISCGKDLEKLDLYRALDDWPSTSEVVYTGFTKLIEISDWLSDVP